MPGTLPPLIGANCLILGAGSLGRLLGALLPADTAALVPRQRPREQHCRYQFRPLAESPRWVLLPWADLERDFDKAGMVLVTTKAQDTSAAIAAIQSRISASIPLVLFQNGLGSQQAVTERFPEHPILAASTTEGANRPTADTLVHAGTGDTWVGALNDSGHTSLPIVVKYLQTSGLSVHPEPEIEPRLWQKLVINAGINAFTALLDCPNGAILDNPFYLQRIDTLCEELSTLMRHEGLPTQTAAELRRRIEAVAQATARNTSSMRADLQNHRTTEIDFINGYVANRCESANLNARVNRELTNRVKELETV